MPPTPGGSRMLAKPPASPPGAGDILPEESIGDRDGGEPTFPIRCAARLRALSIASLATPPSTDAAAGFLALINVPKGVELGCMLGGSETDRSDGTRLGTSAGISASGGASRGVLACDDDSELGEPGDAKGSVPTISSGVGGIESDISAAGWRAWEMRRGRGVAEAWQRRGRGLAR